MNVEGELSKGTKMCICMFMGERRCPYAIFFIKLSLVSCFEVGMIGECVLWLHILFQVVYMISDQLEFKVTKRRSGRSKQLCLSSSSGSHCYFPTWSRIAVGEEY